MIRTKLRRYDVSAGMLQKYQAWLAFCNVPATFSAPPSVAVLQHFSTASGYSILIDLRKWLETSYPDYSQLAVGVLSDEDIRSFFDYGECHCEMQLPDGELLRFESSFPATDSYEMAMLNVATNLGKGWLCAAAGDIKWQPDKQQYHHLPFRLSLLLGRSYLRLRHVNNLKCGDVLVINTLIEVMLVNNVRIGTYSCQEETLMVEEYENNVEFNEFDLESENNLSQSFTEREVSGLNNLPVKLDFIVYEKTMTLRDLKNMATGDVISTTHYGENSVAIRANNVLIARGELVWVEDKLCVEVQTLINEAVNGK